MLPDWLTTAGYEFWCLRNIREILFENVMCIHDFLKYFSLVKIIYQLVKITCKLVIKSFLTHNRTHFTCFTGTFA